MSALSEAVAQAAQTFGGRLVQPSDHGYDETRRCTTV